MKNPKGLNAISEWLITEIKEIEQESITLGKKNQKAKRRAEKAKKLLWIKLDTSKPKGLTDIVEQDDDMISETTYNAYLTRLRRRLSEACIVSFSLGSDFNKLLDTAKVFKKKLKKIDLKNAITIRKGMKELKAIVEGEGWYKEYGITKKEAEKIRTNILSFSPDLKAVREQLTRTEAIKSRMEQRARNRRLNSEKAQGERTFSIRRVIMLANALTKSDHWTNITIGLGLATGRRPSEILHFGHFEALDKHRLKFSGQRKNKDKAENTSTIPCLIDSALVVDAIERLRQSKQVRLAKHDFRLETEAEQALKLNNRTHTRLNESISGLMNGLDFEDKKPMSTPWRFSDTRAAYAHTALAMLEAREASAGREFKYVGEKLAKYYFQKILLHTNSETSEIYHRFTVEETKNELKRYHIDKAKKRGEDTVFGDRIALLNEWLTEVDRAAYIKYLNWCVAQLKQDPLIEFNTSMLRTDCGGRAQTISEFFALMKKRNLHLPDLIIITPEDTEDEPKTVRKLVEVTYTLTFTREIEVSIMEDEDENALIEEAIRQEQSNLDPDWADDCESEINLVEEIED